MRLARPFLVTTITAGWLLLAFSSLPATSQALSQAPSVPVPSRVLGRVDENRLVTLSGNTHPLAQPRFDTGLVAPSRPMERMLLLLNRSPEQEAALAELNRAQTDPHSSDYHHWLHALEFGRRFGPSDADLAAVTTWLKSHGFAIDDVSQGRVAIQFTGTAEQVQETFHLEIHTYQVDGVAHIANDHDPEIPEALAPVVRGIASLHDFFAKPQSVFGNYVKKDLATGRFTKLAPAHPELKTPPANGVLKNHHTPASGGRPAPQLTYTGEDDDYPHEEMTPFDFATVYNILPSWKNKILGTGVTIAISGVSDIATSDVTAFRKSFGLSTYTGTFKQMANGTDPGADGGGGQGENTLDVEMAGATAPNAAIVLVVSKSTSTTGGDLLSDEYIIDKEIAPIMTASYGECELNLGKSGNAAYNAIWQQGATEGISIFNSSGDQGSAGCTSQDSAPPVADQIGLQVNGMASSPYQTAVGGTDFTWSFVSGGPAKYWNTSNAANGSNAKGYMPEVPWNSTCANPLVYPIFTDGYSSPEELCNAVIPDADNGGTYEDLLSIASGSGGISHCTTGGTTSATCTGGYAKPSWQTGLGVPNDSHRDVPDVSLFASGGFPDGIVGSAILDCEASNNAAEKTCDYTNPDYIVYQETGGTSASSPLMAGIMALVVQKTGSAQGLANPTFYSLFAKQVAAGTACDSSTGTASSSCVFNDISTGTNAEVCYSGGPNCTTNDSNDEHGILSGYAATKGYDRAVGLGTVNVTNLVNAWPTSSSTAAPAVTLSATTLAFANQAEGTQSAAKSITVTNSGGTALTLTSITLAGGESDDFALTKTCASTLAAGASCSISVTFDPVSTGAKDTQVSIADNATGSPQKVTVTGTGTAGAAAPTVKLSVTSLAFGNETIGTQSAAKSVTVTNGGSATLTLTGITLVGGEADDFALTKTCGSTLAAGASCSISVTFTPKSASAKNTQLSIADNATGSPQTVSLTGTGTAATGSPGVKLSATSLAFANQAAGTHSSAKSVTVTNSGTTALTLTAISVIGGQADDFALTKTCGTTLAAGASCTVSVSFTPPSAGSKAAQVSITDNASGSPQKINVTGTGT